MQLREAIVTIMPPFQDEHVVLLRRQLTVRMLVVKGDPGYIIGNDFSTGSPTLLPVQGSSQAAPQTNFRRRNETQFLQR